MSRQAFCQIFGSPGPRQHRMTSAAVLHLLLTVTVNMKVISADLRRNSLLINHFNNWVCLCGCVPVPYAVWKQYHLPLRKQAPWGDKKHKGQGLKKEWWPVMNISGIPRLQAAAGFSIGEVDVPAKGHRSKTLQEAPLSPYWPQQSCTGTAPTIGRAH